jgi:aryl-alcohol dehydrogenase-like predicted oxidoreductase
MGHLSDALPGDPMTHRPTTPDSPTISRRDALRMGVGAGIALALPPRLGDLLAQGEQRTAPLIERAIPSSGEKIPVVGIGTARRYDVGATPEELAPLREVLRRFPELGGKVIDTSPNYGRAESVSGELVRELGNRQRLFIATKTAVRSGDPQEATAQLEESLRRFGTDKIDLLQVHNLTSVDRMLPLLREWKAAGRVRYVGVTTSFDGQYAALEALMRAERLDAIQVDYAVDNRNAAERILPLAAERGMAVLVNLPFGRTRVFQNVQGRPLPDWAKEIDATSWAQIFLKYILGHPAVTCVIPGTAKMEYLTDNLGAARGRLPDEAMRRRIEAFVAGQEG